MQTSEFRVGLFGIGLEAYWSQFPGLEARLRGYVGQVAERIGLRGARVIDFGLADSLDRAVATAQAIRREDPALVVLYATTYALSSTVLAAVRRLNVPIVVLSLQPGAAIEYAQFNALDDRTAMTGEWLAWCSACPMPEIANVFARAGIPFRQVIGALADDRACWQEMDEWVQAAEVLHALEHCRIGLMGHYYSGMLDIATDLTKLCAVFGTQVEMLEVDELSALRAGVEEPQVAEARERMLASFDVGADCDAEELLPAARTAAALDAFVERHRLAALAYYYQGSGVAANEETMRSIILGTSLLTGRGIPTAGEYEVKNVVAMKMMDRLGAGGSFSEFYGVDFRDDVVLLGHDGPGHPGIAAGKVRVRPLRVYHGKVGRGLSVEMSVEHGPVTLLSVAEDAERGFKLVVAEGTSEAGPILEIGNTNSRYRFSLGARGFLEAWNAQAPAHHCAIGVGHIAEKLRKLASLLKVGFVQVC
ncbi:MAG TPA: arabinose isomerase [Acidobacteriaceae bacterium]|jgi:L-arabinose isomerase|nr:arabinose isomerase [Acidobacteriaceae bacterium]